MQTKHTLMASMHVYRMVWMILNLITRKLFSDFGAFVITTQCHFYFFLIKGGPQFVQFGSRYRHTGMPRIPWQFVVIKFSVAILILRPFKGTMLSLFFLNMSSCVVFPLQGQWNNLGLHCIMKEIFHATGEPLLLLFFCY